MTHLHSRFLPDFLIIPYALIVDDRVNPLDEKVYATLYWMERLRGGICNPSNDELSTIVHAGTLTDSRSVQNSLTKLEDLGYITREYADETKRTRISISTNVSFQGQTPSKSRKPKKAETEEVAVLESEIESPRNFARRFFSGDKDAIAHIGKKTLDSTGLSRQEIMQQILAFAAYWTEPNGSGKKQRWELQKTFEVGRRFSTWMSRRSEGKQRKMPNVV